MNTSQLMQEEKTKLTTVQMQRAVYRAIRNIVGEARGEMFKCQSELNTAQMRLESAKHPVDEEDYIGGFGPSTSREEASLKYAEGRYTNSLDNLRGWEEILEFTIMVGFGMKPTKIDYPVVENGGGI